MKYPIKELLSSSKNYTRGRRGSRPEFIFVHYTASQASALNNCKYFARASAGASAHYFLDGSGTIWRSVRECDTAWTVGNWDLNKRSISIEVVSDGRDFSSAEVDELTELVQHLMKKYNLSSSRVVRHFDAVDLARRGKTLSPHKRCPKPYVNASKWEELHAQITGGKIEEASNSSNSSKKSVLVDGWAGYETIQGLQTVLGCKYQDGAITGQWYGSRRRHWAIKAISYSGTGRSELVKKIQRLTGVRADGYLGKNSIIAWQKYLNEKGYPCTADGWFGRDTARATQKYINDRL